MLLKVEPSTLKRMEEKNTSKKHEDLTAFKCTSWACLVTESESDLKSNGHRLHNFKHGPVHPKDHAAYERHHHQTQGMT